MPEWQKIFEAEYATVGIILLNRLAKRCGMIIDSDVYAFHGPEDLADVKPANLRELGHSGNKAGRLVIRQDQYRPVGSTWKN